MKEETKRIIHRAVLVSLFMIIACMATLTFIFRDANMPYETALIQFIGTLAEIPLYIGVLAYLHKYKKLQKEQEK